MKLLMEFYVLNESKLFRMQGSLLSRNTHAVDLHKLFYA